VRSNPEYNESVCKALVFDITSPLLPKDIKENSLDVCICIFVLSAINPRDWVQAARNIYTMLKPGGLLLFRDYGRYDLAQIRMKKNRLLQDNFYCRGDGTRVYFFTLQELSEIFSAFEILQNASDKRLLINRQTKQKMFRCWQQAKFRKPLEL
jgi:tRNAThr (cytosine32-N3)-methyltransferase